jgi:hypothetical protein
MTYRELFEAELDARNIIWCRGTEWRAPEDTWRAAACDSRKGRGGRHASDSAWATEVPQGPTIHYGAAVSTRATLQIALHEVGHIVLGHTALTRSGRMPRSGKRVYEVEAEAERWAFARMRELGVAVPKKARQRAARYVDYKKRRGDKVIARREGGR